MTIALEDLHGCFEGVIPSIIATASAEGTPNISYLSHVARVDETHIALSNQFFAKTAANIRANPRATLLLVDGNDGSQYALDIEFERSIETGPLFEHIALQLRASSAQVGMADVMRLRSADIFLVHSISAVASPVAKDKTPSRPRPLNLAAVARISSALEAQADAGGIIDALLSGLSRDLGYGNVLVLLNDPVCGTLTTVGSVGYQTSGLGSEVRSPDDLISTAAAHGRSIKVSDMSRVRRFGEAILNTSPPDENASRSIAFPKLSDAMSQLAVPMIAQKKVRGVVFVESRERMAFLDEDVAAVEMLARQAAAELALSEAAADAEPISEAPAPAAKIEGRPIQVVHHRFDDSVFIDNDYVIKGVAGRLLVFLLESHLRDGRREFSNREIRLSETLRLPDIKDNLETRLLLLRRRLEQKAFPVRLIHSGRGRITLELDGMPEIRSAE